MSHAAPMGGCDLCGTELPSGRSRWCSDKCSRWWWDNHRWTQARKEARRKARVGRTAFYCADCHQLTYEPEVNHIVPCMGKHGEVGCHHHQDNLEVLCHPCHVTKTNAQRAAGAFRKRSSTTGDSTAAGGIAA